jgi:hypothetical protein
MLGGVRFVPIVVVAVAALTAGAAAAPVAGLETFRTPSRNIACGYLPGSGGAPTFLRCDVLSGLRPEPRRPCELDWTGASMRPTGRATASCAGDTVYDPRSRILDYGQTWRRGGFRCTSRTTGLTCTNRSGHGFFLSRQRWRLF